MPASAWRCASTESAVTSPRSYCSSSDAPTTRLGSRSRDFGPAPDREVTRNAASVVQRTAGTCSAIEARNAWAPSLSGASINPMHTPPSSSVNRSALRRSTPAGGGWGSVLRTGVTHQCCDLRRPATQRRGLGPVARNSPSSRSVASTSSTATGATPAAELAASRRTRPRVSASHTPTSRPFRAMATRRRTSCQRCPGPLEDVWLMGSVWGSCLLRARYDPSDGSRQEGDADGARARYETRCER